MSNEIKCEMIHLNTKDKYFIENEYTQIMNRFIIPCF